MPRLEPRGASHDEAMWEEWAEWLACSLYEMDTIGVFVLLMADDERNQYVQFVRTSGRDGELLLGEVRLGDEPLTDSQAEALNDLGWIEPGRYGLELAGPNFQCIWLARGVHSMWTWQLPDWNHGVANALALSFRQE